METQQHLQQHYFIAVYALVAIYGELKISSFIQDKVGPMGQGVGLHAWKWGLLQPVADALKLILKEDIIPSSADKKLFILAPAGSSMEIAPMTSQGSHDYRFELDGPADKNYEVITYIRYETAQIIVHIDGAIENTFAG